MSEEELIEAQDSVYNNILALMAEETDSKKLQEYSKALESIEKGRNERASIELNHAINESKVLNEKQVAERKANEEENDNKKRRKLELGKAILDGTVKVVTLVVSSLVLGLSYKEEIESYRKNIETKREANNMLKNNK